MKRIIAMVLSILVFMGNLKFTALAETSWPPEVSIEAESGILMDADSGAVLYEKNSHSQYPPASITKILTALVVLEQRKLDEMVTFSHNAVYNVDSGSTSLSMDEGDVLSVKDCLYGMLLKSANEVANALAEHTSGSIEDFAEEMNKKARELGCTDSNFVNPSGLHNDKHLTTAYDMALIARGALQNETFVAIDSTLSYKIDAVTKNWPEGTTVSPGHKMLKEQSEEYYPGVFGGKTGYTSLAGNTLVTYAEKDGMRLIAVVMKSKQTHYADTKKLLDYGFGNFKSVKIADLDSEKIVPLDTMQIQGLEAEKKPFLSVDSQARLTIPKDAQSSQIQSELAYDLKADAPKDAVAKLTYTYAGKEVGEGYLLLDKNAEAMTSSIASPLDGEEVEKDGENNKKAFPVWILWTIAGVVLLAAAVVSGIFLKRHLDEKREQEQLLRSARRQQRLKDAGIPMEEFDRLMSERIGRKKKKKGRRRW